MDKDFKKVFVSAFHYAVKVGSDYFHVSFLETCKSYGLCPTGLSIRKKPFIVLESDKLKVFWKETVENTEKNLFEAYVLVYVKGCSALKKSFGMSYMNWKRILTMKTLRNG